MISLGLGFLLILPVLDFSLFLLALGFGQVLRFVKS